MQSRTVPDVLGCTHVNILDAIRQRHSHCLACPSSPPREEVNSVGGAASPGIHWTPVSPCSSHCSGIQGGPEWLVAVSLEFYNPEFWWALRTTPVPLPPPHCTFLQDWHYQPLDRSHSNAERQPFQPQGCFRCSANGVYNGSGGHRHFPGTRVMCPSPISAQLGHTQCEQGRVTEVEQESQ